MINFQNITLHREQKILFENASFTLHNHQKVGLIGANGAGKSSLFALLLRELDLTSGEISHQGDLTIAHVAQETKSYDCSALDYVLQGDEEFYSLDQKIKQAEQSENYDVLGDLHNQLGEIDGYSIPNNAARLLSGLGFNAAAQQKAQSSFSGGWQMRLSLARALMCRSDMLLLDEPTNHLDLEAILWLEKWLQSYQGLLIVISHDREFLDKVIDSVLHVDSQAIKLYSGNYTRFEAERARQLALQQSTYEKQQKNIKHLMKFVDKFRYKATKAKQAQSRLKSIEKIVQVAAVQASSPFRFDFQAPDKVPYPLLKFENATLGYDGKVILKEVDWQLVPGDRVALLGPNGAGKSTLVKSLAGKIKPINGVIEIDKSIKIGYFEQSQLDALHLDKTAMDHMFLLDKNITTKEMRNYLGGFGFQGDEVLKAVENFSGGEKARLALAMIVWQRPNLLLLDEPTNHLDMEMQMALLLALQGFEGALVLVSHDRHLIRNTVDNLWLVAHGEVQKFDGDLEDYQNWVYQYYKDQAYNETCNEQMPDDKPERIEVEAENAKPVNTKHIERLEKKIAKLEERLKEIGEELSDPSLYEADGDMAQQKLYTEQEKLQAELAKLEAEWLQQ